VCVHCYFNLGYETVIKLVSCCHCSRDASLKSLLKLSSMSFTNHGIEMGTGIPQKSYISAVYIYYFD